MRIRYSISDYDISKRGKLHSQIKRCSTRCTRCITAV
nr:MAG TPA: Radical SAM superfamily [Caudoviricetes sp.]